MSGNILDRLDQMILFLVYLALQLRFKRGTTFPAPTPGLVEQVKGKYKVWNLCMDVFRQLNCSLGNYPVHINVYNLHLARFFDELAAELLDE